MSQEKKYTIDFNMYKINNLYNKLFNTKFQVRQEPFENNVIVKKYKKGRLNIEFEMVDKNQKNYKHMEKMRKEKYTGDKYSILISTFSLIAFCKLKKFLK
jgi:hypothetical protein